MKGVSESLAGRVELIALTGFQYAEIDTAERDTLWFRGGFPRSFLADSDSDSVSWRKQFMTLVAERDLPGLGVKLPPTTLLRLWTMMAHWHGQTWNAAEPARSLGISETSVHRLTEFFEGLYLIRLLRPWHVNSGKRQVRSPKLYIRDSGLCNTLLGIHDRRTLVSHPKTGSTWEGFVIEELIAHYQPDEAWFWGTHNGAELDLLIVSNGIRTGFEIKLTTAPTITASMRIAMTDLELDRLYVVHGGNHSWQLADRVEAVSLDNLPSLP
jgi:predicted AAA+ superfamily ATPase